MLIARGGVINPSRLKLKKKVFSRITFLSTFEFQDGGILTRKSANIGTGHFVSISPELEQVIKAVSIKNIYNCQILRRTGQSYPFEKDMDPSMCAPEKIKKSNFQLPPTVENVLDNEDEDENEPEDISEAKPGDKSSLFKCPNDLCIADYIRFHNLTKHIREGICKGRLRSMSQANHVKILWFKKFGIQTNTKLSNETSRYFKTQLNEVLEIVLPPGIELLPNNDDFRYDAPLTMGYAMKVNQKLPKITEELHNFIENLFNKGQITNQKYTPADMKKEIHKNFPLKEWLTWSQVKGKIGTLKAQLLAKGSKDLDPDQLQQQAEDEITLENAIKEVTKAKDVLNNTSNWLSSHPLEVCTLKSR